MNINSFATKVKKLNDSNSWIILLVSYLFSLLIFMTEISSTLKVDLVADFIGYIVSIIISILCCILFYDKHLNISTQYVKGDVFLGGSLAGYMKFHGFSVEEYFLYIMKQFLPVQTIMAIGTIAIAIVEHNAARAAVGVIVFIIPFLVWKIRKSMFYYSVTHRGSAVLETVKGCFNGMIWMLSLVLVIITYALGVLEVSAFVGNILVPLNDNSAAVCISDDIFMLLVLGIGIFWSIILYSNGKIVRKCHIKGVLTVMVVLAIAVNSYSYAANHTIIEGEKVTDVKNFEKSTYSFNEVDKFEVFEDESEYSIAMKIYLNNDETISVSMANYSNTDKWDEKYDNEYEFIKDITIQLLDKGAEGRIIEPDKMIKDMKEYLDSEEYENAEKTINEIVELLSEQN